MSTSLGQVDRVVEVVKLDERSKYTTFWPLGRVEVGGRAYFHEDEQHKDN